MFCFSERKNRQQSTKLKSLQQTKGESRHQLESFTVRCLFIKHFSRRLIRKLTKYTGVIEKLFLYFIF